jgi:putative ubiquitin-RnfH superfamily antitoxin RatB of RatAB toxin-antitoxin module
MPEAIEDPDERVIVSTRIKRKSRDTIDRFAAEDGVDRSEALRELLADAVAARQRRAETA